MYDPMIMRCLILLVSVLLLAFGTDKIFYDTDKYNKIIGILETFGGVITFLYSVIGIILLL